MCYPRFWQDWNGTWNSNGYWNGDEREVLVMRVGNYTTRYIGTGETGEKIYVLNNTLKFQNYGWKKGTIEYETSGLDIISIIFKSVAYTSAIGYRNIEDFRSGRASAVAYNDRWIISDKLIIDNDFNTSLIRSKPSSVGHRGSLHHMEYEYEPKLVKENEEILLKDVYENIKSKYSNYRSAEEIVKNIANKKVERNKLENK